MWEQQAGQCYRHSGRVPGKAFVGGLAVAVGLGLLGGGVFGYLELYAHLIPIGKIAFVVILLGTLGLGVAMGGGVAKLLRTWNARSTGVAMGLGLLGAVIALYGAWVGYLYAFCQYSGLTLPVLAIARPDNLWEMIQDLCAAGVWSIGHNDRPSGIFLALIWLTEAGIVLVAAGKYARSVMNQRVFCEHCGKWGSEKREMMQVEETNSATIKKDLLEGRVDSLCAARAKSAGINSWCDVSLEGCADCDNLQTLSVEKMVYSVDKKGKATTKTTVLVRRLMLSGEQTLAVIQAAALLKAPVQAAEEIVEEKTAEMAPAESAGEAVVPEASAAKDGAVEEPAAGGDAGVGA